MLNVVITGGTGLVGKRLSELLVNNNCNVTVLTRSLRPSTKNINFSLWDLENNMVDIHVITKADCIIHLAGEGIANKRWTANQQRKILKSRVEPLAFIFAILSNHKNQLKTLVSASGIGYYGARTSSQIFNEEDDYYSDFLGETCEKWEGAVDKFSELNIRTVKLRTGIVLSKDGGALPKMMIPFKWGLGSGLGSGKQYMPWIHINDLCSIYLASIQNSALKGAYNAVVNDDTTNMIFTRKLAKQLKRTILLPNVPSFLLKLALGKMAVLLLEGSRVSNNKIKEAGFVFEYEDLDSAFTNLIN